MMRRFGLTCLLAAFCVSAQDTRNVVEPRFPAACATVKAQLTGPIAEADEGKLDTERLQSAIDSCGAGKGVLLIPDGAHNAFLSGQLSLRSGVTLVISKGATLHASRDPRLYA